jgi:spermidine synthase
MSGRRKREPVLPGATISEYAGVRYLHLGSVWVQGAMRKARPRAIELEYVQRMMVWLLFRPLEGLAQAHAVQLGLGAAAITRFTHQVLRMRTTAVELNPTVIEACRLWFQLPADDARLRVLTGDAGRWIAADAAPESIAALCVDIYDDEAAAPVLDDQPFYAACRAALAPGGMMTVNLFGRDARADRSGGRIAEAFGTAQVWVLAPTREGNTIVVAGRGVVVPDREVLIARAEAIEARWRLPARKWLRLVRPFAVASS